jgi:hypothetical protein
MIILAAPPISSWTVIASILGSSVISALVSYFAGTKLKGTDFRYNFRKYIVDKRINAYEKIELLLNEIRDETGFYKLFHKDERIEGQKMIKDQMVKLRTTIDTYGIWFSPQLILLADEINKRFIDLYLKSGKQDNDVAEMKLYENWNAAFKKFKATYFDDIVSLSEVENFIKFKKQAHLIDN